MNGLGSSAFWLSVPPIVLINVLLSGDTAVVIALACRALPLRQRRWGMALGAAAATLLLIVFASIITPLLVLPYVKVLGGIALIYIAVRLLLPETTNGHVAAATSLWRVVRVVLVADLVLSLDNVIAIAAVAHGDLMLLMIGVAVSIPIIVAGAALITVVVDRFPLIVWAGAALLGWIAGDIIASDPVVSAYLSGKFGDAIARHAAIGAAAAGMLLVIAIGAYVRRRRV